MKRLFILICIAIFISGCVTNPMSKYTSDMKVYIAENRPKAIGGTISWSEYYTGALTISQQIPANSPARSDQISQWLEALNMAKEFEAGRITKEYFYKWREEGNARIEAQNSTNQKIKAQCEYEARVGAAGVKDTGRSGLNIDQIYKEQELFNLCLKAKQQ